MDGLNGRPWLDKKWNSRGTNYPGNFCQLALTILPSSLSQLWSKHNGRQKHLSLIHVLKQIYTLYSPLLNCNDGRVLERQETLHFSRQSRSFVASWIKTPRRAIVRTVTKICSVKYILKWKSAKVLPCCEPEWQLWTGISPNQVRSHTTAWMKARMTLSLSRPLITLSLRHPYSLTATSKMAACSRTRRRRGNPLQSVFRRLWTDHASLLSALSAVSRTDGGWTPKSLNWRPSRIQGTPLSISSFSPSRSHLKRTHTFYGHNGFGVFRNASWQQSQPPIFVTLRNLGCFNDPVQETLTKHLVNVFQMFPPLAFPSEYWQTWRDLLRFRAEKIYCFWRKLHISSGPPFGSERLPTDTVVVFKQQGRAQSSLNVTN